MLRLQVPLSPLGHTLRSPGKHLCPLERPDLADTLTRPLPPHLPPFGETSQERRADGGAASQGITDLASISIPHPSAMWP